MCTVTKYPTQSHYSDSDPTNPCHILIMLIAWLGSDKYQLLSHCIESIQDSNPWVRIPRSIKTGESRTGKCSCLLGSVIGSTPASATVGEIYTRTMKQREQAAARCCHLSEISSIFHPNCNECCIQTLLERSDH